MFSLLRKRLGVPGLIGVIALVFAMMGGAYAASDNGGGKAVVSAKKGRRGPKGPKGATGPAGPQGPAGPAGPAGQQGPKGDSGEKGAGGVAGEKGATGVTGTTGAKGATGLTGTTGVTGEPWTAGGTLPKGATETGSWFAVVPASGAATSISFPIPLKENLEAFTQTHAVSTTGEELDIEKGEFVTAVNCLGTAAAPTAKEGELCIYFGNASNGEVTAFTKRPSETGGFGGASTAGALLEIFLGSAGEKVWGTFAVTGK